MDHEEGKKKVLVISHRHLISWGKKSFPTSNAGTRAHPSHLNSVFQGHSSSQARSHLETSISRDLVHVHPLGAKF